MLAVVRRWYRIIALVVVGVTLLLVSRRLLAPRAARPSASPIPAPPSPAPSPATPAPVEVDTVEQDEGEQDEGEQDGREQDDGAAAAAVATGPGIGPWVAPTEGQCPADHPVKAKESSGIYHVDGGLNYARTNADRCYLSPEAAEADGYRPAKR